jgi:hypothetical protein
MLPLLLYECLQSHVVRRYIRVQGNRFFNYLQLAKPELGGRMTVLQLAITDAPCQFMHNFIFKCGSFIELLQLHAFKFAEKGKIKI